MDTKNSREILERFFELLKKQPEGAEGASVPLPLFEPGDEITLRVESVQAPRNRSFFDDDQYVPVQLDEESEIRLVALLELLDFRNGRFDAIMKDSLRSVITPFWSRPLEDELFSTKLPEYIMRQKLVHMDPERIAGILGELREPEFVSALLDLLREADPERAKAVEAALPPSPEAMQAELEALRRQVSELEAERDALLRAQHP